jgi:hypothetical protein
VGEIVGTAGSLVVLGAVGVAGAGGGGGGTTFTPLIARGLKGGKLIVIEQRNSPLVDTQASLGLQHP